MEKKLSLNFHMTVFQLKMIAMTAMFLDHAAAVLINPDLPLYFVMRVIGRLAFPIYCFLLVEGFYHTRNLKKYIIRLGAFALLSEIPFDLAFFHRFFYPGHQNTLFTLLIGMVMLAVIEYCRKKEKELMVGIALIGFSLLAFLFKTDYDALGIIMIFVFYEYRDKKKLQALLLLIIGILSGGIQTFSILAVIPILSYRGEKGRGGLKYFFYLFYPFHLLFLYIIYLLKI